MLLFKAYDPITQKSNIAGPTLEVHFEFSELRESHQSIRLIMVLDRVLGLALIGLRVEFNEFLGLTTASGK
jgi:hypothetical protein